MQNRDVELYIHTVHTILYRVLYRDGDAHPQDAGCRANADPPKSDAGRLRFLPLMLTSSWLMDGSIVTEEKAIIDQFRRHYGAMVAIIIIPAEVSISLVSNPVRLPRGPVLVHL